MKLRSQYIVLSILAFFLGFVPACVDPYGINIKGSKGNLIVEGTLNNLNEQGGIRIARTDPQSEFISSEFSKTIFTLSQEQFPETGALVSVVVNGAETIFLSEVSPGFYKYPDNFKGEIGNSYQLKISRTNGDNYSSSLDKMLPVAPIDNYFEEFNPDGTGIRTTNGQQLASNDIYVDYSDPANEQNFYQWEWTSWELKQYCATCRQGRYNQYEIEEGVNTGDCFRDLILNPNDVYDYTCQESSWQIFRNSEILIFSDAFTNGQPQKAKRVAQIPLYQSNPCLVSIRQSSLQANAYRYFKLLEDQAINTGTLADTPPAPIRGNVFNDEDDTEPVLGYFVVSAAAEERINLSRSNARGGVINGLFFVLNNREAILEPTSSERIDIPLALCKETENTTSIMPKGWRFGR